jgi:hypothetical protein
MSDDYNRPTLTFPGGAYNATQVRLYGIAATQGLSFQGHPSTLNDVQVLPPRGGNKDAVEAFNEILKKNDKDVLTVVTGIAGGWIPWPLPIPIRYTNQLPVDTKDFGKVVISTAVETSDVLKGDLLSVGIIVAYAYEGHTYDLPKPKIMLIKAAPSRIPLDDSGFDKKSGPNNTPDYGYRLWIVDKLDECIELEVNQGFVEQLVLEANLPGKRAPTMYAGRAKLGHRSGRLTE